MALRKRKDPGPENFSRLSIFDFLPLFTYSTRDGRRHVWVNWPIVVALTLGVVLGRWLGV